MISPVATGRYHLTFPESLIDRPLIYQLGRRFDVVTNIRRANVDESRAWVILEIDGEGDEIARALAWLTDEGVQVDRIPDSAGP